MPPIRTLSAVTVALLGSAAVTTGPPAGAAPTTSEADPPPAPEPLESTVTITVQDVDPVGTPLGPSVTYAPTSAGSALEVEGTATTSSDAGSGGSSSASGCRRVEVTNTLRTSVTHSVAYRYITWLRWCWNRSAGITDGFQYDFHLKDVAWTFYYRGNVTKTGIYYEYRRGYSKSGFRYHRQDRVENCVFRYGCISNTYPSNVIRGHSDGTYSWWTDV